MTDKEMEKHLEKELKRKGIIIKKLEHIAHEMSISVGYVNDSCRDDIKILIEKLKYDYVHEAHYKYFMQKDIKDPVSDVMGKI